VSYLFQLNSILDLIGHLLSGKTHGDSPGTLPVFGFWTARVSSIEIGLPSSI
jgi:hypothetical protein